MYCILIHCLLPKILPITISILYRFNAYYILYSNLFTSVYNLNDTHNIYSDTILFNIFGELLNYNNNYYDVVILCVGIYLGIKSDIAAHNITIEYFGKYFFIYNIPFKYIYIDVNGINNN